MLLGEEDAAGTLLDAELLLDGELLDDGLSDDELPDAAELSSIALLGRGSGATTLIVNARLVGAKPVSPR